MIKTQVDMCYDEETAEEAVARIQSENPGLKITIIDPHGPGGGWPVVDLEGEAHVVARVLKDSWGIEDDIELWELYGVPTYSNFATTRKCTTDKLDREVNRARGVGWNVTAHFVGGRDWVLVCQR